MRFLTFFLFILGFQNPVCSLFTAQLSSDLVTFKCSIAQVARGSHTGQRSLDEGTLRGRVLFFSVPWLLAQHGA